jgi:hypothetical protein
MLNNFKILIFIVLIVLILISCSRDKRLSVSESEFNIPMISTNLLSLCDITPLYFKAEVRGSTWANHCIIMYSSDSIDQHYMNSSFEIQYFRILLPEVKPAFIRIVSNYDDNGFVIIWINKFIKDELVPNGIYKYSNEIDETTDTIYTSLKHSTIQKIYPKFKGCYKHLKIDKIVLDYYWYVESYDFYNTIKLGDFNHGFGMFLLLPKTKPDTLNN